MRAPGRRGVAARLIVAALLAMALPLTTAAAQDVTPNAPRLVFELSDGEAPPAPDDQPVALRVVVSASGTALAAPAGRWPIWLTIRDVDAADPATWAARVRALVAAVPTLAAVELHVDGADPRRAAFLLKLAAAEIRARSAAIPIVLAGPAADGPVRDAVMTSDVTPSVDAIALPPGTAAAASVSWIEAHDPGATIVAPFVSLPAATAATQFAAAELAGAGTVVATRGYHLTADALRDVLRVVGRMRDVYGGELVPVSFADGALTIHADGVDVTSRRSWRVLYNLGTLGTYVMLDAVGASTERLDLSLVLPSSGAVVVRDPVTGRDQPAARVDRDDASQRTRATIMLPGPGVWLVDFNRGAATGFLQQEEVTGSRSLSLEEIVARHQARQAAERVQSPRYVVDARIQQYFRPSVTDPGFDVITENRFFVDRVDGTEWEERTFSVNGARFGEPRPPFPLLQPEKVLSPPLAIELDARYRYRLQGTARVNGRNAWVVAFEPQTRTQSLYRGTVWIDRETFVRLRQQAVQTGLSAPVISNDETQDFTPVPVAGGEVWLPSRIYNQQLLLIAGRNLLVERRITFSDYAIAPGDFAAQRQAARAGARTMYRDTDLGVRYFIKDGDGRVVSDVATTRAKALALGLTIDPGFKYPLPIGGINYLNFRFLGRPDTQVAVLFAGVLAAGNIQRSKAIANRIDASVDFFAIAPPSTERVFAPGGERVDQSLLTWPLSTGLNLGWQGTTHQRISGQYLFRFDGYVRDSTTAPDYVTPTSAVTNGLGVLYEYRRGGYSMTTNATWWQRTVWRPWGDASALTQTPASYVKYQASATKVFYLGAFSKVIVNGAYHGGHRLDRFSQYQFGLFDDTRIHGVPAAGVRYGELGMVRGQYSFNILDQYRTDLFVDRAWGRVRGGVPGVLDVGWEPITGVGVAFNVRVPGRVAFLRGEVGQAWLPGRYRGLGSTTVQIMLLKPLN